MTCTEKIDEIEKLLDYPFATNFERFERIREIVDETEDKTIPLDKVKQAREEMENGVFDSLDDDGSDWFTADKVSECMAILDKLIEEVEE
jgi:hypothetical protein